MLEGCVHMDTDAIKTALRRVGPAAHQPSPSGKPAAAVLGIPASDGTGVRHLEGSWIRTEPPKEHGSHTRHDVRGHERASRICIYIGLALVR